jgi:hypothetical protein
VGVVPHDLIGGRHGQLPAHAEVEHEGGAAVQGQHDPLAAPLDGLDAAAG